MQIEVCANITTKNCIASIIQETPGRNRSLYSKDVESPNFPNQSLIFIDSPESATKESEGFPGSWGGRKFNSIRLAEAGRTIVTVPRILKRSDATLDNRRSRDRACGIVRFLFLFQMCKTMLRRAKTSRYVEEVVSINLQSQAVTSEKQTVIQSGVSIIKAPALRPSRRKLSIFPISRSRRVDLYLHVCRGTICKA